MRGKNRFSQLPPRYTLGTMKHCLQTTIVMQMQQWARNWGWHGRCILPHSGALLLSVLADIGSRRNNAFRHVVIVRSRRSRKPTAHLRPYEYGIPSFVPKDPSVSRASLLSLLSIRSIFGNFVLLDTMSGGIEAIKIGRINCWNAWISSREERIETLVGISINTVDRNALIDSFEKSFSFLIFV